MPCRRPGLASLAALTKVAAGLIFGWDLKSTIDVLRILRLRLP